MEYQPVGKFWICSCGKSFIVPCVMLGYISRWMTIYKGSPSKSTSGSTCHIPVLTGSSIRENISLVEIRASLHLFYEHFSYNFLLFPFISSYWLCSHITLFGLFFYYGLIFLVEALLEAEMYALGTANHFSLWEILIVKWED